MNGFEVGKILKIVATVIVWLILFAGFILGLITVINGGLLFGILLWIATPISLLFIPLPIYAVGIIAENTEQIKINTMNKESTDISVKPKEPSDL